MSSSTGEPSKKFSWYRSMCDKFDNEARKKERDQPRESAVDKRKQKVEDQLSGGVSK